MMFLIIDKKMLITISLIIAIIPMFSAGIYALTQDKSDEISVLIDPGHGEPDGGCVGALGSIEQEINLNVARKTAEILVAKNITAHLTRTSSLGLWSEKSTTIREKKLEDMKNRRKIMENSNCQLFISIHMNSYPSPSASGIRIFYDKNHEDIRELCEQIQARMSDVTGAKTAQVKPADRTLFLMKDTPMPAILIECGFLTSPKEEQNLMDSVYRSKLAWAIADACEKYFIANKVN
ncbi:MAG: hypothetical protein E7417_05530 [Ruminococcaceae bacterium]|nr:hypothetical protein [Oscillospiraceae bacterium]